VRSTLCNEKKVVQAIQIYKQFIISYRYLHFGGFISMLFIFLGEVRTPAAEQKALKQSFRQI